MVYRILKVSGKTPIGYYSLKVPLKLAREACQNSPITTMVPAYMLVEENYLMAGSFKQFFNQFAHKCVKL